MYGIEKKVNTTIRNELKTFLEFLRGRLSDFEDIKRELNAMPDIQGVRFKDVELLRKFFKAKLPFTATNEDILREIDYQIEHILPLCKKLEVLKSALSKDYFKTVTYSLPFYPLLFFQDYTGMAYMTLSGIVYNAEHKDEMHELMDDLEKRLLEYEREISKYIEVDVYIELDSVKNVVALYKEYLEYFLNNVIPVAIITIDPKWALRNALVSLAAYIIYVNTPYDLECEMKEDYKKAILSLDIDDPNFASAVEKIIKDVIATVPESAYAEEDLEEEPAPLPIEDDKDDDLLCFYMENGRVIHECDLALFQNILEESDLPIDLQREYYAQMKNLINRRIREEFDTAMTSKRNEVLSSREQELYSLAKKNAGTAHMARDIDAIIELLLGTTDPLEEDLLRDELKPIFEYLELTFASVVKETPDIPKMVYFKTTLRDSEGKEVTVPKILLSVKSARREYHKTIVSILSKLKNGNTGGDRPLKIKGIPCRVFVKGKDYKIYYALVGDEVVVIDGLKTENASYIENVVRSEEFKTFLENLGKSLNEGILPDDSLSDKLVLNELANASTLHKTK